MAATIPVIGPIAGQDFVVVGWTLGWAGWGGSDQTAIRSGGRICMSWLPLHDLTVRGVSQPRRSRTAQAAGETRGLAA